MALRRTYFRLVFHLKTSMGLFGTPVSPQYLLLIVLRIPPKTGDFLLLHFTIKSDGSCLLSFNYTFFIASCLGLGVLPGRPAQYLLIWWSLSASFWNSSSESAGSEQILLILRASEKTTLLIVLGRKQFMVWFLLLRSLDDSGGDPSSLSVQVCSGLECRVHFSSVIHFPFILVPHHHN